MDSDISSSVNCCDSDTREKKIPQACTQDEQDAFPEITVSEKKINTSSKGDQT